MPTLSSMVEEVHLGQPANLQPSLADVVDVHRHREKRPYKHGIYGFTEPTPNREGVQPMTNASRSSKAPWNILNQHDRRSVVVGWWPSHPAEPIRGAMVSDLFHKVPQKPSDPWPLKRNAIHPPERVAEVARFECTRPRWGPRTCRSSRTAGDRPDRGQPALAHHEDHGRARRSTPPPPISSRPRTGTSRPSTTTRSTTTATAS